MTAIFPDDIYEQRTLENITGVVFDDTKTTRLFAEDIIELGEEVIAIETELGTNPKGTFDDVAARLDSMALDAGNGNVLRYQDGVATGDGGFSYDPDAHTVYIYADAEANSSLELARLDGITMKLKSQDAQVRITFPGGPLLFDKDDKVRVRTAKTPSSHTDTGNQGDICWDSGFIYICIATNSWKRVAIASW